MLPLEGGRASFQRGATDVCVLSCRHVGSELTAVRLSHDGFGPSPAWLVDSLTVEWVEPATGGTTPHVGQALPKRFNNPMLAEEVDKAAAPEETGEKAVAEDRIALGVALGAVVTKFAVAEGAWVDEACGRFANWMEFRAVRLAAGHVGAGGANGVRRAVPPARYEVETRTGGRRGAATDANVFVKLYGTAGESEQLGLESGPSDFAKGRVDRFAVESVRRLAPLFLSSPLLMGLLAASSFFVSLSSLIYLRQLANLATAERGSGRASIADGRARQLWLPASLVLCNGLNHRPGAPTLLALSSPPLVGGRSSRPGCPMGLPACHCRGGSRPPSSDGTTVLVHRDCQDRRPARGWDGRRGDPAPSDCHSHPITFEHVSLHPSQSRHQSQVSVSLFGAGGLNASPDGREQPLEAAPDDFGRGSSTAFRLNLRSVGDLQSIRLRHSSLGGSWYLDHLIVEVDELLEQSQSQASGSGTVVGRRRRRWVFQSYRWFGANEAVELALSDPLITSVTEPERWMVAVATAGKRAAGTGATVYIELVGEGGLSSGQQELRPCGGGEFERGGLSKFELTTMPIGELQEVVFFAPPLF